MTEHKYCEHGRRVDVGCKFCDEPKKPPADEKEKKDEPLPV